MDPSYSQTVGWACLGDLPKEHPTKQFREYIVLHDTVLYTAIAGFCGQNIGKDLEAPARRKGLRLVGYHRSKLLASTLEIALNYLSCGSGVYLELNVDLLRALVVGVR